MTFWNKTQAPKLRGLAARPTQADLTAFKAEVSQEANLSSSYCWKVADGDRQFVLHTKNAGPSAVEWRLMQGAGPSARQLWMLVTGDISQIYAAIVSASGEDLQKAIAA